MPVSPRRALFAALSAIAVLGVAVPASRAGAATSPYCGPTIYKADGTPWVCTFDDEFTGSRLDTTKWTPVTTAASGLTQGGACYEDGGDDIAVRNGALVLSVRKESSPFSCAGYFDTRYSAGQVATSGRFAQTYGAFSVRARFPSARVSGLQSSIWMWPQNLASTGLRGEVDVAEWYSVYPDRVIPYLHYGYDPATVNTATATNVVTNSSCQLTVTNWHVYTVIWTHSNITVKYDGRTCLTDNVQTLNQSPFDQPFFLALTQTLGTGVNAFTAGSTPLPSSMQVDWVRAWK